MSQLLTSLRRSLAGEVILRRNPLYYKRARKTFSRLETLDRVGRETFVMERLGRALAASRMTDYGKRVNGGGELESWPLLTKELVQSDADSVCRPGFWPTVHAATGGTTGSPLRLRRSLSSLPVEQAAIDHVLSVNGVDGPTARIAVLRADFVKDPSDRRPPYWVHASSGRRLILSSQHLDADSLEDFVRILASYKPQVLWVYPSALESLCVLLRRERNSLSIPLVLSSSEMMTEAVWRLAEEALGCRIVDYYGQAERVGFAFASEPGKYRFLAGYSYVELIPIASEDEVATFEIVGTSLWNDRMPLVRYRTGDMISLPSTTSGLQLAEISLGVREFGGVIGRMGEYLISPAGGRIIGLNHLPRGVDNLLRMQLIQETRESLSVRILATESFGAADLEALMANLRQKLPAGMRFSISHVESLESSSSGKCPFVIRRPSVSPRD